MTESYSPQQARDAIIKSQRKWISSGDGNYMLQDLCRYYRLRGIVLEDAVLSPDLLGSNNMFRINTEKLKERRIKKYLSSERQRIAFQQCLGQVLLEAFLD